MAYLEPLEQAVMFIENHLEDEIDVHDVAKACGYSYYHLTRLMRALFGESVGGYIKNRRLASGSKKLIYTDKKIVDIALEAGFTSPEAFSRAFKLNYGVSPVQYRKNRLDLFIGAKRPLEGQMMSHLIENVTVKPTVVEMGELKVAGIRGQTSLKDNVIPALWAEFTAMPKDIPNVTPRKWGIGVCEGSGSAYNLDGDVLFSEFVGVEVSGFEGLGKNYETKVLRPGRYAVFTHSGPLTTLEQTYNYIYCTWFLATKEKLDNREDFEVYDERYRGFDDPDSEMDIYIPIV